MNAIHMTVGKGYVQPHENGPVMRHPHAYREKRQKGFDNVKSL